jgi:hypothetical protein
MSANDGVAHVGTARAPTDGKVIAIQVVELDEVLGTRSSSVMKLDVEGFELAVLQGAARALAERRIRHIVFEDHIGAESATVAYLRRMHYEVFTLGWSMRGPTIGVIGGAVRASPYEAPSYIASIAPDEVQARMARSGWRILRRF